MILYGAPLEQLVSTSLDKLLEQILAPCTHALTYARTTHTQARTHTHTSAHAHTHALHIRTSSVVRVNTISRFQFAVKLGTKDSLIGKHHPVVLDHIVVPKDDSDTETEPHSPPDLLRDRPRYQPRDQLAGRAPPVANDSLSHTVSTGRQDQHSS